MNETKPFREGHKIALPTGIKMAYDETGPRDGVPVLLIHGITDGRTSWEQVAPLLAERGCHCYAVDYRGNGETDKPDDLPEGYTAERIAEDLLAFTKCVIAEKVHLVGHSYGTAIVQELLYRAPERFLPSVMMHATCDLTKTALPEIFFNGAFGFPGFDACEKAGGMPEEFVRGWTAVTNEDRSFAERIFRHAMGLPVPAWKNLVVGASGFNSKPFAGKIREKVLILWGTADELLPAESQAEMRSVMSGPNFTYVDLVGTTHNGHWDSLAAAELYARYIEYWVKGMDIRELPRQPQKPRVDSADQKEA